MQNHSGDDSAALGRSSLSLISVGLGSAVFVIKVEQDVKLMNHKTLVVDSAQPL